MNTSWSRERLEGLASKALRGQKLIVVSCRAPYTHERVGGRVRCVAPAGGLTAALRPIMAAVGGVWIAEAGAPADRESTSVSRSLRVPPEKDGFALRRLSIPARLKTGHYDGISNGALWPLCHNVFRRPVFRDSDWSAYRKLNELFAEAVLEEAQGGPAAVFIQDYHFALLPRLLKARNPRLTVGQFWHIPFPVTEMARIFPWIDELVDGMLGNDSLGFHLASYCRNFADTAVSTVGAEREANGMWLRFQDHATSVREAPISIDFHQHTAHASSPAVDEAMLNWRRRAGNATIVGLGIDRIDYTKGIPERLRALDSLFKANPQLCSQLTFVQVGVPSRASIAEYAALDSEIESEVMRINLKWGTDDWTPIVFVKRNLAATEMMALHRLASFCLVTPLHDGMNLVAKEFVASRFDLDGVLILSRFAGCAQELQTALSVNPFSESEICTAIAKAITMSKSERRSRMTEARAVVAENNVYRWAGELLEALGSTARAAAQHEHGNRFGALATSVA